MSKRTNINRGFMKLWVWQDAKELYKLTYLVYSKFPNLLYRVASNQIAAADSVQRNIAEGYCRKSKKEYLRFLGIAISSLGEVTSSNHVYIEAGHFKEAEFEKMDTLCFKLENGLRRLIKSIRNKKDDDWNDEFTAYEPQAEYVQEDGEKWKLWNKIYDGESE